MSAQWKGALTGRIKARLAPRFLANTVARSTAALLPEITVWSGELRFAAWQTSPCADSAHTFSTSSAAMATIAAIAPTPTGTASCIYLPRLRTVRTASANDGVPAATLAEYSPRLCPTTYDGVIPCDWSTRHAATDAVRIAGWVISVSLS